MKAGDADKGRFCVSPFRFFLTVFFGSVVARPKSSRFAIIVVFSTSHALDQEWFSRRRSADLPTLRV
jgi:hypothetical protein